MKEAANGGGGGGEEQQQQEGEKREIFGCKMSRVR